MSPADATMTIERERAGSELASVHFMRPVLVARRGSTRRRAHFDSFDAIYYERISKDFREAALSCRRVLSIPTAVTVLSRCVV